jgi:hypothetical protein
MTPVKNYLIENGEIGGWVRIKRQNLSTFAACTTAVYLLARSSIRSIRASYEYMLPRPNWPHRLRSALDHHQDAHAPSAWLIDSRWSVYSRFYGRCEEPFIIIRYSARDGIPGVKARLHGRAAGFRLRNAWHYIQGLMFYLRAVWLIFFGEGKVDSTSDERMSS